MHYTSLLIATALISTALPLQADVTGPGGKVLDFYCTDKSGSRVELGEFRCLSVDGRSFMAQCQMSLNVPMWREVQSACPSAALNGAQLPQTETDHPLPRL